MTNLMIELRRSPRTLLERIGQFRKCVAQLETADIEFKAFGH